MVSYTAAWHNLFLNFIGVGVTLEVRLHRLVMGENGRRESGKMLGCVTRGDESDGGVGVGVTLEVWAPPLRDG